MDRRWLRDVRIGPEVMEALLSSTDQGFCVCEIVTDEAGRPVDYRFLAVNPIFAELTGLPDAEGRTALELVPDLEPFWPETYGRVALDRLTQRFEQGSESMGRWFEVFAIPVEPHGRFAVVFRDVTREKRLEAERKAALDRAEALLEELNHRVMNSLGMIVSIIGLETRGRSEGEGRRALERIGDRVRAVGDLYRLLGSPRGETDVQADDYLPAIVARLASSIGQRQGIRIVAEIEPLALPTQVAVPLGLIVTELVTNSLKYAFGDDQGGCVRVSLALEDDVVRLCVSDNGRGMACPQPPDRGIGRKLVAAFARQLEGEVATDSDGDGTRVKITFPPPNTSG